MHAQRTGTNPPRGVSFDHGETLTFDQAQKRRVQPGAQLAHVPLSPAQLEDQLNVWAMQGGSDEKRNEAKQRILGAHRAGANQLDLQHLSLSTLPECIGKLTNLIKLYVTSNNLTRVPESICELTNLQVLQLGHNQLTTLPGRIGELTKLRSLVLALNQLTTLPESIGKLTDLKEFFIWNNPLEYLPSALADFQRQHGGDLRGLPLRNPEPRQANQHIATLPESISKLPDRKGFSIGNNRYDYLPSSFADYQKRRAKLSHLPLQGPAPGQANQHIVTLPENINKSTNLKEFPIRNKSLAYLPSSLADFQKRHDDALRELPLRDPATNQASESMLNISPAELEALRNLKKLPPDLNSALADLKKIDSVCEQLHVVVQAQQGVVSLSALPQNLASIPQCAQFYQVALKLLLRSWFAHQFVASQVMKAEPRPWVTAIQALFKAAPVPGLSVVGFGFAALVNQIDTVMKANKGQLLLNPFNNSNVKFEQVAHTVASLCTERLESELRALPENNKDQKPIGLGKQLKALYTECQELAQRLNLQANPLVNPLYPAANKADELMSLLLHKLCTQDLEPGRSGAMPQAHENNFVERMSNYCVGLLLPTASNTLVVGRKLLGHKAFALAPYGGSSQGRAASPPRSISPNSFARATAAKDAELAELKQQVKDLKDNMSTMVAESVVKAMAAMQKAEAASTLAETATQTANKANRQADEVNQRVSMLGLSKQSAQQVQHNLGRLVLTQSSHGTHAAQSSMGFQPGMEIGQHRDQIMTLSERVDNLDHTVAELRQFDLLDTPLSAPEFGRVVTAYLQEHGRLHDDGTVALNNKPWGLKYRPLLAKLKDIHSTKNRGGDYKLGIELFALLKKMPDPARLDPRQSTNLIKLHQLIGVEKKGLKKPSDDPQKALQAR